LVRDLYRHDEHLLRQLRQAHLQGDTAALARLWNQAAPYAEAKTA
jgi:hypothetical protein